MEETLQPLEADRQMKANHYLAIGIVASVILHLACTVVLLGLPPGSPGQSSVTYIDLGTVRQPAPAAPPQKTAAPEKAAQKPEMPLPQEMPLPRETPIAPESPPPQVQQSEVLPDRPAAPTLDARAEEQPSLTTLGLGLTKGYFKSLGDGETLREDVRGYYLEMLQGINEKWWLDQQLDKKKTSPLMVNITVARNGEIVGSRIMRSSGDPRYDRAVMAALVAASPLPPLPPDYEGDFFEAPIRLVPPLNLMAW